MEKHILYILILKNKAAFKVGITSNSNSEYERIKNLHRIYDFDLSISWIIETSNEKISRTLEKQIHNDYKVYQYYDEKKRWLYRIFKLLLP